MRKGTLTREEAISIVGEVYVENVDVKGCEPTNRVGYNGSCQGDDETEWASRIYTPAGTLVCYYYTQSPGDEDPGRVHDWTIEGYEIY